MLELVALGGEMKKKKLTDKQIEQKKELMDDFDRVMRLLRQDAGDVDELLTELFMKHIDKAYTQGYSEGKEYMKQVNKLEKEMKDKGVDISK